MSHDFKALSLTALLVDDNATTATEQSLGFAMLKKNVAFATFAVRMQGVGRNYFVREKGEAKARCIEAPDNFEREEVCGAWLCVCFREYVARKRKYESKATARKKWATLLAVVFVVLFALMYYRWPLWNVLIDLEAEEYYDTLGVTHASSPAEIKKAYRQQIKKWHPDQNPHCTDHCRTMTMKIQHAHDVLLSRGDHRFELANQYKKELLQLRSFVYFRIYSIAANAGGEISVLIQRAASINLDASQEFKLRVACVLGAMLFFAAYEALFVGGLDLSAVVSFFAYCVSVLKVSAEAVAVSSLTKTAYVDCVREALYVIVPVVAVHVGHILFWGTTVSRGEEMCHMLFGVLYLLAFLYNFSPNLMDNVAMRKFSLPLWSVDGQSSRFSGRTFWLAQVGFLVNDLFVFTCRIPTAYRVVAYALNFLYLSEFFLLPWEAPLRKRKGEGASSPLALFQTAEAGKKKQQSANASGAADQEGERRFDMSLGLAESGGSGAIVSREVNEEDAPLLVQLDAERVEWLDIASNKYKMLLVTAAKEAITRFKKRFKHVSLCYGSDMDTIVICVQAEMVDSGKLDVLIYSVVHDPMCSRLVAIETGPGTMIPDKKIKSVYTAELAATTYDTKLKEKALMTFSELYRSRMTRATSRKLSRSNRSSTKYWPSLALSAMLLLFSLLCTLGSPAERDATRITKGFPAHQRSLLLARYTPFAPLSNVVNCLPAGLLLLRKTSFILFTTDVWELLQ